MNKDSGNHEKQSKQSKQNMLLLSGLGFTMKVTCRCLKVTLDGRVRGTDMLESFSGIKDPTLATRWSASRHSGPMGPTNAKTRFDMFVLVFNSLQLGFE